MITRFRWITAGLVGAAAFLMIARLFDVGTSSDRSPLVAPTPADPAWRGTTPLAPTVNDAFAEFATASQTEATTLTPATQAVRFSGFPIGQSKVIEVAMDSATSDRLTPRERRDQVRDWLLITAVSDAGLTADQMNRVLFDLPPVRHGYLRSIANYEYGVTRACHIGEGDVVALIPANATEPARKDHLAHIADEYRKTLGQIPRVVHIFAYKLGDDLRSADLTRVNPIAGDTFFTQTYGYFSRHVNDLDTFSRFMSEVQDLTYARLDGTGIELGGRKLLARDYRGIRTEDVAAVWQAQDKIVKKTAALEATFARERANLVAKWNAKLKAEIAELEGTGRRRGRPMSPLFPPKPDPLDELRSKYPELFPDAKPLVPDDKPLIPGAFSLEAKAEAIRARIQREYDSENESLIQRQTAEFVRSRLTDHTGFSLDPTYDFVGLSKWFEASFRTTLSVYGIHIAADSLDAARQGLANTNILPLLMLLERLKDGADDNGTLVAKLVGAKMRSDFQFQAARYDGELQGTEIGMVLFYTDLMAKLWQSVDFDSPKQHIPDFRTSPDGGIAAIYRQQTVETPGTRIWFGKEDRAFLLNGDTMALLFARNATRIFAASSHSLSEHEEVPPIQASEHTIGWWNDHYEEIAAFEQEYERLNEYMKWSLVISWLVNDEKLNKLDFLQSQSVRRDNWFPEWVKLHPELKFADWKRVGFYQRGRFGTTTEVMPILFSRNFQNFGEKGDDWQVSGGVSGGRPSDFVKLKPFRPAELPRSTPVVKGVDFSAIKPNSLRTLRGVEHTFKADAPHLAKMSAVPKMGLPQQATHAQLRPTNFDREIFTFTGGVRIETTAKASTGRVELGEFISAPTKNGFRVGYNSRELDSAMALGRQASSSRLKPEVFFSNSPVVKQYIATADGHYVLLNGSRKWHRFVEERLQAAVVPDGVDARVADVSVGAKSYQVAAIPPPDVLQSAKLTDYIRIPLVDKVASSQARSLPIRGPPNPAAEVMPGGAGGGPPPVTRKLTVADGGDKFPAQFVSKTAEGGNDYLWVKIGDLPDSIRRSPERLQALADGSLVADVLTAKAIAPRHPAVELMEQGKIDAAFRAFEADSAGFRAARDAHHTQTLDAADRLSVGGRPVDAQLCFETGRRVNGDTPALLFRQGLAEIREGNAIQGIETLNRSLSKKPVSPDDPTRFLDEINHRLQRPLPRDEQLSLTDMGRAATARHLTVSGHSKATIEFGAVPDRPTGMHIKAALEKAQLQTAEANALDDARSLIYLDDSLHTGTGDLPASAVKKLLDQPVAGSEAELFEIHRPDAIFSVRPRETTIGTATEPASKQVWSTIRLRSAAPSSRLPIAIFYNLDDDDEEDRYVEITQEGEKAGGKRKILVLLKKGNRK